MLLALLGALYFAWVTWAGLLWASIKLVDRENPTNHFIAALVISAINIAVNLALPYLLAGVAGLLFLRFLVLPIGLGYLVLMVRMVKNRYGLSTLKTIGVFGLLVAAPYVLMDDLERWVGYSQLRALLVLFGMPTAILGVWIWGRRRARFSTAGSSLPRAELVTRAPSVAERPDRAVSEPAPVPPVARPETAPPARVSQPIAPVASAPPKIEPAASPTDGPRFLR